MSRPRTRAGKRTPKPRRGMCCYLCHRSAADAGGWMYSWDPERHTFVTFMTTGPKTVLPDDREAAKMARPRDHWLCEACRDAWIEAFVRGRERFGEMVKKMGEYVAQYTNPRAG